MKTVRSIAVLVAAALLLLLSRAALADGFIVIHDAPPVAGHFSFAPLEVVYHHVTVDVQDQVATTSVDQEFYNPNNQRLEGTYLFPLPPGTHIDKFSMDVNGTMMDAELLSADKARAIYEEIVRKAKDPALLEYVGRDAFKVRIFPIEPNSNKHIKITYTQLLTNDTGLTEYSYPLNTEKFSSRPLKDVSIKLNLSCSQSLKSVYSPSHNVEIHRDGEHRAVVGYEERNVRPDTDFKLIFTQDAKEIGINLLTYRAGSGDGYFLLLAAPDNGKKKAAPQPKDICFVLDTSGSMAGKKMEQARKALTFCLANLNETDRFEVVRFSTETEPFFDKLVPANKDNLDKAQKFVDGLKAIGATAIDEAMKKALSYQHDEKRPYVIVFLTDGQPTIGETREDAIVGNIQKISSSIRIFPFGIGTDVNTHLLDRIADGTNAFSQYVLPEEDLEVKLSNFYTKIKEPVLANVTAAFEGSDIKTSQLYPNKLPDLFKGQMLMAFGRYTGKGPAAVKITGTLGGEQKVYTTDVNFTENDTRNAFIPRLWATRRVGWLLDEIRLHGESAEVKEEVVRLAREHGIVTPYTAYLIIEDESRRHVPVAARNFSEMERDRRALDAAKDSYDSTTVEAKRESARSGGQAVDNSTRIGGLKSSENAQAAQPDAPALAKAQPSAGPPVTVAPNTSSGSGGLFGNGGVPSGTGRGDGSGGGGSNDPSQNLHSAATQPASNYGYRQAQNYTQQARVVNGRAFYQNGDVWTDSGIQAKKDPKRQEIKFNSDEYFALLAKHPEAAQWLALGNNVDLLIDETVYSIR